MTANLFPKILNPLWIFALSPLFQHTARKLAAFTAVMYDFIGGAGVQIAISVSTPKRFAFNGVTTGTVFLGREFTGGAVDSARRQIHIISLP
jgi:hypothetical protein